MEEKNILQLKVRLLEIKPLIWRRILIEATAGLDDLHRAIQLSMGWENYHLYSFTYGGEHFDFDGDDEPSIKLSTLGLQKGDEIFYEYDFGDCWKHKIRVEKLLDKEAGLFYPRCIDGKRSCPPEDSGGPWGYEDKLEILHDKAHPDYEEVAEWMGGNFDPERFDIKKANNRMEGNLMLTRTS